MFAILSPPTSLSVCSWHSPAHGSFNIQQGLKRSCEIDDGDGGSPTTLVPEPSPLSFPSPSLLAVSLPSPVSISV